MDIVVVNMNECGSLKIENRIIGGASKLTTKNLAASTAALYVNRSLATISRTNITDNEVNEYANEFSKILRKKLANTDLLINSTIQFIRNHNNKN